MKILILAGGGGTRLFPLSRDKYPKQFIKFFDNESLIQKTVRRLLKIVEDFENIIFLTNKDYIFLIKQQIKEAFYKNPLHVITEPFKRNTAPAIALGIKYLLEKQLLEPNEPIFVFPADHIIEPEEEFVRYILESQTLVREGKFLTFGIVPSRPETGYGYIEADRDESTLLGEFQAYKVKKFHEKPSLELAQQYVKEENYFWNSGIFGFTAETFLEELKLYAPEIFEKFDRQDFKEMLENFQEMPDISIDYAIMEKTKKAYVIPLKIFWSDVGSFEAIYEILKKDSGKNAIRGKVFLKDTENCLIYGNNRLITGIGLKDLLIVETEDVLLIAQHGEGQKIKEVVSALKRSQDTRALTEVHVTEYRPWGSFTVLEVGERYKIKKIIVNPGEKLSLQMHHHRSEHWVVVKGTAKVRCGNKEFFLHENESVFIPKSTLHRLENPGKIPLEIIEVQVGEYIEEDDIIRFEDIYEREDKS